MKIILIALLVMTFSGCTAVKYNGARITTEVVNFPKIGQTNTVNPGDNLVMKGSVAEELALTVLETVDGFHYDIMPIRYTQIGYDSRRNFFAPTGVVRSLFADPAAAISIEKGKPEDLCVVTVFSAASCYRASYKTEKVTSIRGKSFQQWLIYNGRIGNKINIGYREYKNDLARPSFNNEVEYDLSISTTIGYKGALIEVISADNNSITYKLIRNFP